VSITSLDSKFENVIDRLIKEAKESAEGLLNQGQPANDNMAAPGEYDRTDPSSIHQVFDRSKLAGDYAKLRTQEGAGSYADLVTVRFQHDVLSGLERDLQMRCRGRIASVALAASTRNTFGDNDGPLANIRTHASVLMVQGSKAR
jgi:hypothetical protein